MMKKIMVILLVLLLLPIIAFAKQQVVFSITAKWGKSLSKLHTVFSPKLGHWFVIGGISMNSTNGAKAGFSIKPFKATVEDCRHQMILLFRMQQDRHGQLNNELLILCGSPMLAVKDDLQWRQQRKPGILTTVHGKNIIVKTTLTH